MDDPTPSLTRASLQRRRRSQTAQTRPRLKLAGAPFDVTKTQRFAPLDHIDSTRALHALEGAIAGRRRRVQGGVIFR